MKNKQTLKHRLMLFAVILLSALFLSSCTLAKLFNAVDEAADDADDIEDSVSVSISSLTASSIYTDGDDGLTFTTYLSGNSSSETLYWKVTGKNGDMLDSGYEYSVSSSATITADIDTDFYDGYSGPWESPLTIHVQISGNSSVYDTHSVTVSADRSDLTLGSWETGESVSSYDELDVFEIKNAQKGESIEVEVSSSYGNYSLYPKIFDSTGNLHDSDNYAYDEDGDGDYEYVDLDITADGDYYLYIRRYGSTTGSVYYDVYRGN